MTEGPGSSGTGMTVREHSKEKCIMPLEVGR